MPKIVCLLTLLLSLLTLSRPAYAYLDPGTGSIILQLLLGGVAGALVVGRLYWQRVKELFGIKPPPEKTASEGEAKGDQN